MFFAAKGLAIRYFSILLTYIFIVGSCLFDLEQAYAKEVLVPGLQESVTISDYYELPKLYGYKLSADNPLRIEFVIGKGDVKADVQDDLMRSVNYFLAALTTDKEKIWVNLSPYEADRIIDKDLEITDMGRDLLAQDYLLKQLASGLTNPQTELGKKYWANNAVANDLNKLWISPNIAQVYDQENLVIITDASLKVESEDGSDNVLIPAITDDVNHGKNFARLRQIYNSIILAQTFKAKFFDSLYKHYINKSKISGIEIDDKTSREKIYNLYCEAFKKGAYNITKKEYDPALNIKVKRKYFSGGFAVSSTLGINSDADRNQAKEVINGKDRLTIDLVDNDYALKEPEKVTQESMIELLASPEPLTILVAEDEKLNMMILVSNLSKLGHTIVQANNAFDVIEIIDEGKYKFDLFVSDNRMPPGMDGSKLIELMRKPENGFDYIPTLIQSATVDSDDLKKFGEKYNVVIFDKPNFNDQLSVSLARQNELRKEQQSSTIVTERKEPDNTDVRSGGIEMMDFAAEGIRSSLLFDGVIVDYSVFDRVDPTLVSFSRIGDVESFLN